MPGMGSTNQRGTPMTPDRTTDEDSRIVAAVVKVEFEEIPRRMPSDADLAQLGRRVVRSVMDDRHGPAHRRLVVRSVMDDRHGPAHRRLQRLLRDTAR
jgi:hypothetical protein